MASCLHEAARLRAFSFTRNCMLPFLRSPLLDSNIRVFMMHILSSFLFSVSSVLHPKEQFAYEAHYIQSNKVKNKPSFLMSRQQFIDGGDWQKSHNHEVSQVSQVSTLMRWSVRSIDRVMSCHVMSYRDVHDSTFVTYSTLTSHL